MKWKSIKKPAGGEALKLMPGAQIRANGLFLAFHHHEKCVFTAGPTPRIKSALKHIRSVEAPHAT